MESPNTVPRIPLAVIGAGPHALTLVLRLLCASPAHTDALSEPDAVRASYWRSRCGCPPNHSVVDSIKVFDPSGRWMAGWTAMFSALEIPHLRSPAFLNPDPSDSHGAIFRCAAQRGLKMEEHLVSPDTLFEGHKKVSKTLKKKGKAARKLALNEVARESFALPSTELFDGLCKELVASQAGLADAVVKAGIKRIIPISDESGGDTIEFELHADDGRLFRAERVVVAVGPQSRPRIPDWIREAASSLSVDEQCGDGCTLEEHRLINAFGDRLIHTCKLAALEPGSGIGHGNAHCAAKGPLRPLLRDKDVIIVGGGLTSAHILLIALEAGCRSCTLLSRRPLEQRQFDLDSAWMTRARNVLLSEFHAMPVEERARFAGKCRGGGTITPEVWKRLWDAVDGSCGRGRVMQGEEIKAAICDKDGGWKLELSRSEQVIKADLVILATGCSVDVSADPLFADLFQACPIPAHMGIPQLDADLQWAPGVNLHVLGSRAALQLGPDALNLAGAMGGAKRLYPVLRPFLEDKVEFEKLEGGGGKEEAGESLARLMGGDGNLFAALEEED